MYKSTPFRRLLRGLILTLVAPVVLSACTSTGKNTETRFYLLSTLPASTATLTGARSTPPLVVALAPVQLPQYLERPQIVTRVAQNQLELSEFDNWGGSLGKNMARVLASNLSALLGTANILTIRLHQPSTYDARVEIQVLEFERGPHARASLKALWRIFGPGRDAPPKHTRISLLVSDPIPVSAASTPPGRQADVAAMSQLLGKLSETIAQAIIQTGGT